MVRQLHWPRRRVFLARSESREYRRHEVVCFHTLHWEGVFLSPAEAQYGQRPGQVPAPAGGEQRRCQDCLLEGGLYRAWVQHLRYRAERETVLRAERQYDGVVICGCLELEVEGHAKTLAKSQPERTVDPTPERSVHHELHPACIVEKPLEDHVLVARHRPELGKAGGEVLDKLPRSAGAQAAVLLGTSCSYLRALGEGTGDQSAEERNFFRQLSGAARRYS